MNDSRQHTYSLEEKPVISFDNNNLIVKSDRVELSYLLDNVVKYYFIDSSRRD